MSRHEIERDYGINRKSIKDLEFQKDKNINSVKKNSFWLEVEVEKKDIEEEILIWFHTCRRNGLAITSNQINAYAIKNTG